jgi:hypothetical protein
MIAGQSSVGTGRHLRWIDLIGLAFRLHRGRGAGTFKSEMRPSDLGRNTPMEEWMKLTYGLFGFSASFPAAAFALLADTALATSKGAEGLVEQQVQLLA